MNKYLIFSVLITAVICVGVLFVTLQPPEAAEAPSVEKQVGKEVVETFSADTDVNNTKQDLEKKEGITVASSPEMSEVRELGDFNEIGINLVDGKVQLKKNSPAVIKNYFHARKLNPQSLSMFYNPKPFDEEAYKKDKDSYLHQIVPARVNQFLNPGKNTPIIAPNGSMDYACKPLGSVDLSVKVKSHAPVTFTTTHGGVFKSTGLSTVTVAADKNGIADVTYVASRGTLHQAYVLCASPLTSGQLKFSIYVIPKDQQKPEPKAD